MTKLVKFLDLLKLNQQYREEIDEAIAEVLDSGMYLLHEKNQKFCEEFSHFCGTSFAIGVANGLDALTIIIRALELGENDEIIVPANTYIASLLAISQNNCKPVLVEPSLETYNIDPEKIEEKITPRTRAIMVVHLYGNVVNMDPIWEIANAYGLKIIEDSAQSHGALFKGQRSGSLGDASGFSFYPGKNLGCLGDGGGITTDDNGLYERAKTLANYGSAAKYENRYKGFNSRLDELQAAVLSVKLKHLDDETERRRVIAKTYISEITNPSVTLPPDQDLGSVWHLFPIRSKNRDDLQKHLQNRGIQTLIHYPIPPHRQEAYSEMAGNNFRITEKIHREILSIPISPVMTELAVEQCIEAVNEFKTG
ncbi:DegT/DnrJ/EryC1/StrS family aminotransferase [Alphaproteobacteria bacterium]|nr:DegT/DnrJ/EryC1/StrS family aminotransferase [Alphaproteobacteria bacterium]